MHNVKREVRKKYYGVCTEERVRTKGLRMCGAGEESRAEERGE